jgi:hypothetical protein
MSIDTIVVIRTCIGLLKRTTKLFLTIIPQGRELSFAEDVIVAILAVVFGAFKGVEVEHVARPRTKILHRQPHGYYQRDFNLEGVLQSSGSTRRVGVGIGEIDLRIRGEKLSAAT